MGFKGRSIFDRSLEISLEQADGKGEIKLGAEELLRGVHQSLWAVQEAGTESVQSLLHFLISFFVPQKSCQIKPGARAGMAGGDLGAIFAFGNVGLFVFFGDAG